jgi:hypothetical protein
MKKGKGLEADPKRKRVYLDYLLWFFFGCLIFIWFKNNFTSFRKFHISPIIPLVLLAAVFLFKLVNQKKQKRLIRLPRLKVNKALIAIIVLLLLAAAFRIPFLVHNFGLYTSDHAVSALMAKHISEGKLPPIYYYGQLYLGTVSEHFFAGMFLLFGYSVFWVKLSTLLFYLAFIAVQFLLLKEIFPFDFALAISLFYCLPIGHLVTVSFFNTAPFALTLLFGTLLFYLTYHIAYRDKFSWIPGLGFLMGLSFWTHQISMAFILTCLLVLVWKLGLQPKKYATLCIFGLLGSLPFWIHEIYEGFSLVKFLMPGEGKISLGARIQRAAKFLQELFFLKETPLDSLFLALVVLGFGMFIFLSFKKRTLVPQSLFTIFFFLFLVLYIASDFSDKDVIRYLYPLYICLPVLLFSIFSLIKSKAKYVVIFLLFVSLFLFGNLKEQIWGFQITQGTDRQLRKVVNSIEKTGKRYWRGEYWSAYLISALSKEKAIVDSWAQNRYFPYRLDYYNRGENNNFVFLRGRSSYEARVAERLIHLLDRLDIGRKTQEIGESLLIYDVESTVFPPVFDLKASVPSRLPNFELTGIRNSEGYLFLTFTNHITMKGLHLRAQVKIPDFSTAFMDFSWNTEEIGIKIPFPDKESFKIQYHLDYIGLKIPSSEKEIYYSPPEDEVSIRREGIVNLSGSGPIINFEGKMLRICEKEVSFEINRGLNDGTRVHLYLYSPFQFDHPYWYGEYSQKVRVEMNSNFIREYEMEDGANHIEIPLEDSQLKEKANILTLRFDYHLPFDFSLRWKTAALLEKIEIQ